MGRPLDKGRRGKSKGESKRLRVSLFSPRSGYNEAQLPTYFVVVGLLEGVYCCLDLLGQAKP